MEELLGYHQEDARKRAERVGELRRKRFEAEFEIWLAELSGDRKTALAAGMSTGSKAAMALYREAFAKETGFEFH